MIQLDVAQDNPDVKYKAEYVIICDLEREALFCASHVCRKSCGCRRCVKDGRKRERR
jgi:hypothetical protein